MRMVIKSVDIFISGGGIAGLIAAASFAKLGFSVLLADPSAPPQTKDEPGSDLRSTAFLAPGCELLEYIGIWSELAPYATALNRLRVADCRGLPPTIATERMFKPADLNQEQFGWNLPNWLIRKLIAENIQKSGSSELRFGTGFDSLVTRDDEAIVALKDGSRVRARLAIAADGRESPLRQAAGIDVRTTRYGQKALAFVVTHDHPHKNVSSEFYLSGGAFTLVPLADIDGAPASAVVWMEDGPEATRLAALDRETFGKAATERSCGILGALRVVGHRAIWPVVTQLATGMTAKRLAIIAEAAHVMPPIGAQGLNTSLQDIAALVNLAESDPGALGTEEFLRKYEKARRGELLGKSRIIDMYNRLCRSNQPPVQEMRGFGLQLVHDMEALRRTAMRVGMGAKNKS